MSETRFDVVVFEPGAMFLDLIFEGLGRMPELGEERFAKQMTIAPGGAYNTAVAMARLGLKVALVAQVGTDLISRYLEARILEEGVDCSHLMRVEGDARAITVSMSFPEDRAFVSHVDRQACFDFPPDLLKAVRTRSLLFLSMPSDKRMLALARTAREAGIRVAMDLHQPRADLDIPAVRRCLEHADLLLPNASEAKKIAARRNIRSALTRLRRIADICIKDGSKGALAARGKETQRTAAMKGKVVDTTGAGDNFNAGFISGWLEYRPLLECMARGTICSGLSVRHAGANTGSPTRKEMLRRLRRF